MVIIELYNSNFMKLKFCCLRTLYIEYYIDIQNVSIIQNNMCWEIKLNMLQYELHDFNNYYLDSL